jgi:hypothetical protein
MGREKGFGAESTGKENVETAIGKRFSPKVSAKRLMASSVVRR